MPDYGDNGVEDLSNPLLQQDPDTGRAFHMAPSGNDGSSRPSLEGGYSGPGSVQKGLGGTIPANHMASAVSERAMTPAEMMIHADEMEQQFMEGTRRAQNPYGSSVESSIDRGNSVEQRMPGNQGAPEWLHQYMETQPHQIDRGAPGLVDIINSNKYLSEREKLKYLKSLKDSGKLQ